MKDYLTDIAYYLSNTGGRCENTAGHQKAKEFLLDAVKALGLLPGNKGEWLQPIIKNGEIVGENIIGIKPGKGKDYVLLIAHYDTVPGIPGADDNAAAIAILLDLIRQLKAWNGETNLMVLLCDLEEPPYFQTEEMGSTYFYNYCPIDRDRITCAVVLDLVGHDVPIAGKENALFVTGAENARVLNTSLESAEKKYIGDLSIFAVRNSVVGSNLSDHHIFQMNDVPFLFFTCGMGEQYHNQLDTFDRLNIDKMHFITNYIKELLLELDKHLDKIAKDKDEDWFYPTEARAYSGLLGIPVEPKKKILNQIGRFLVDRINGGSWSKD